MAVTVDTSQLYKLIADLTAAPAVAKKEVRGVISKGALNIKNMMIADLTIEKRRYLRHFPRSISYDIETTATGVEAVIGPDKDRLQGPLGNIVYFGTSNNGPVASLDGPLADEAPNVEHWLNVIAVKAMGL